MLHQVMGFSQLDRMKPGTVLLSVSITCCEGDTPHSTEGGNLVVHAATDAAVHMRYNIIPECSVSTHRMLMCCRHSISHIQECPAVMPTSNQAKQVRLPSDKQWLHEGASCHCPVLTPDLTRKMNQCDVKGWATPAMIRHGITCKAAPTLTPPHVRSLHYDHAEVPAKQRCHTRFRQWELLDPCEGCAASGYTC